MTCRKWVVRGVVLSTAAVAVAVGLLYEVWTNPAATRRQVLDKLAEKFIGASIALQTAHLRLLGGIAVADLRMARRDDLDKGDFLYVPDGILYHDKEQVLDGRLVLRKIELNRPRLRLLRERDGRINLQGILGPVRLDERVPAIVIRQGTILIEDRDTSPGSPLVELKDVTLTVGNDPISILSLDGWGTADVLGPLRIRARLHRASGAAAISLELLHIPVGPDLVQRLWRFLPDVAVHLRQFQALASVRAGLTYQPGLSCPWTYDLTAQVHQGSFRHARVPVPVDDMEATLRLVNGQVPSMTLSARIGTGRVRMRVKDGFWPSHLPASIYECAREIESHAEHLAITPELLAQFPAPCSDLARDYSPTGPVSVDQFFSHTSDGGWHKQWIIRPEGLAGEFAHFRYPLHEVSGDVVWDADDSHHQHIAVDLRGLAGSRPLTVKGAIRGTAPCSGVDLVVQARDVPLDDRIYRALPARSQTVVRQFLPQDSRELGLRARPMGHGDIMAHVYRPLGQTAFANRYVIGFHDSRVRYDQFPLPLEEVSGVLDIRADHWECRGFQGRHGGGQISFEGHSLSRNEEARTAGQEEQEADGRAERHDRVKVVIRGKDLPLDHDFEEALAPPEAPGRAALQRAWRALALRGRLSFAADVMDHPDQPQDIDVGVDIRGCTMRPAFFPYALQDVSGAVRYAHGRVYIQHASARHAAGALGMRSALIKLKPGGGFLAWFEGVRASGVMPDAEFLHALPAPVGKVLEGLHLVEPLDAETAITLDAPAEGDRVKAWWDGAALFHNAALQVGVGLSSVRGQVACRGHHNGRQFESATGDVFFEQATVLNQPLKNVHARAQILPGSPDVLRVSDLKAELFGGTLGGEARVDFGPDLRYEVLLEALQIKLEEVGKHNLGKEADLQGPIRAALHLSGEGNDLSGLRGNGRILVDNGKMYRLPPLLDLLKAFPMLRAPDKTAFEQARVIFGIDGPQIRVHQLDLLGSAVSLRGQGSINLGSKLEDSSVNLEFSADWGRIPQVLPPGLSDMTQFVSDQTFRIRARGRFGEVKYEEVILPGVTDPLRKAMGRTP